MDKDVHITSLNDCDSFKIFPFAFFHWRSSIYNLNILSILNAKNYVLKKKRFFYNLEN